MIDNNLLKGLSLLYLKSAYMHNYLKYKDHSVFYVSLNLVKMSFGFFLFRFIIFMPATAKLKQNLIYPFLKNVQIKNLQKITH